MTRFSFLSAIAVGALVCFAPVNGFAFDPLEISKGSEVSTIDLSVKDEKRNREIPLRVFVPKETKGTSKVILFSHGLGGSREGSPFLGNHWAARGYIVVYMQHAGSDSAVWKTAAAAERMAALKDAASLKSFMDRVKDVPAVLDQLEKWNKTEGHALAGRMDLTRVGMSGHSFGAVTTQAVSGQSFLAGQGFTDPRIAAAVAFSPSVPKIGDPAKAFGSVKVPWMLMTGTKDTSPIGDITAESRLKAYPELPKGGNFELLLEGAEHSAFSDRPLPGETGLRNPNHHKVILALSTAFWSAILGGNMEARKWLEGDAAKALLEKGDRFQWK